MRIYHGSSGERSMAQCMSCGDSGLSLEDMCPGCHRCKSCCVCGDDFDADELGLDPEEEFDA